MSAIYGVLRQLDEWRHLPAYQLERRVDIFFGMFLPKVIEKEFCMQVDEVIPEFPMHKALLECPANCPSNAKSHHTVKVDFAVFGRRKEKRQILLVELKTEMESLNKDQLENMKKVGHAGSKKLLEGVKYAAMHSDSKHKYAHLIWKLTNLEYLLSGEDKINKISLEAKRIPGISKIFEDLCINENLCKAYVISVVILPTEPAKERDKKKIPCGFERLTFADFAKVLENGSQPFGSPDISIFAVYLRYWAAVAAGKVTP